MDLVRLGLERARSAGEAIDVMTGLLERHGQGRVADATSGEAYFSSFLVADPREAWVLETSGRTWAARAVDHGAAISNRLSIGSDWDRASSDVGPGTDFDRWRDPDAWTGHADRRLDATLGARGAEPRAGHRAPGLVALLRHHGERLMSTPAHRPTTWPHCPIPGSRPMAPA
ncbi:MAG: C69 family dipeptidase [Acidimicrobiia bacterium]|nr:C69 family dipeptidase [Acidimicrobiia bacterium]